MLTAAYRWIDHNIFNPGRNRDRDICVPLKSRNHDDPFDELGVE